MPDGKSTQRQDDTPTPPLDTFEFKSIEHLTRLDYQRPSSNQGQSVAIRFFGGAGADPDVSVPEPSSTDGTVDLDDVVDDLDNSRSDPYWPTYGWDTGSDPGDDLVAVLKRKLDRANRKLATADRDLENAKKKLALTEKKLEQAREQTVPTLQELAVVKKRLDMLHKRNMHASQEIAAVSGMESRSFDWVHGLSFHGSFPFLAHYDSTPLITKRIQFDMPFEQVPKILVGLQTSDPSAMVLVCALDVDSEGFTVHADLANHSDFAGRTDLMKCLVSWIAYESPLEQAAGSTDRKRLQKRPRAFYDY